MEKKIYITPTLSNIGPDTANVLAEHAAATQETMAFFHTAVTMAS